MKLDRALQLSTVGKAARDGAPGKPVFAMAIPLVQRGTGKRITHIVVQNATVGQLPLDYAYQHDDWKPVDSRTDAISLLAAVCS